MAKRLTPLIREIASSNNAVAIELANTAHQREVADLKAAGLNPILSASGSGSATPSLTSPVVQNAFGNAAREAITNFSALQSSRQVDPAIDKVRSEKAFRCSNFVSCCEHFFCSCLCGESRC